MNLGRLDHFSYHRIEILHNSEQVDKIVHYAQSLLKKMLPHFAKWSFFLLSPRRTGLYYTYRDWTRAKDCRSVLHNRKKKKRGKRLYFVADAVKWHNATVWSNYRAYVDGLSIEMEDKSFQRKWWRLMVSRGNHTAQFLFDSTPLYINCCKIAQSCEAPFAM